MWQLALGLAGLVLGANQIKKGIGAETSAPPAPRRRPAALQGVARPRQGGNLAGLDAALGLVGPTPVLDDNGSSAQHLRMGEVKTLEQRIAYIQDRVAKGTRDPQIYTLARRITSARCGDQWCVKEKDNLGEAKAIFEYLRKNVRYTSDTLNVDVFQNPILTTRLHAGDCDDYSATTCALLISIGIPARLCVIATKDSPGQQPNHIFAQAGLPRANPQRWVSMDSSVAVPFGWQVPPSAVAKAWIYPAMA